MKPFYCILLGVISLIFISFNFSENKYRKVLGQPIEFERPKAVHADELGGKYFNSILSKSKSEPWVVFAEQPIPALNIKFRDWFYVVNEKATEVLLAKANLTSDLKIESDSYQEIGWVDKRKLLLWNRVLFMSQKDLKNVITSLDKLVDAEGGTMDTRRTKLKETWLEILGIFSGNSDYNNYKDKNVEELELILQGIQDEDIDLSNDKLLSKVKLRDITNEKKVSNEQIRQYIKETLEKYKTLQLIYQDANYEFSYKSGDSVYYWIPVEYLP